MGYIFPYQVQQLTQYQERMLPFNESHPLPVTSIAKTKNNIKENSSQNQRNSNTSKESLSFHKILANMTGIGQNFNEKA